MTEKQHAMPEGMEYTTADEAAECLSYSHHLPEGEGDVLYRRLWEILGEATSPTPTGGDGTDGTVECPGDRLSLDNDDKAGHWWSKLTYAQQEALAKAYYEEFPMPCMGCGAPDDHQGKCQL